MRFAPCLSLCFLVSTLFAAAPRPAQGTQYIDFVDPRIGGMGRLLNSLPAQIQLPHGMMRITPATTPTLVDWYLSDHSYGIHLGNLMLQPLSADMPTDESGVSYAMRDADQETLQANYYRFNAPAQGLQLEATPLAHSSIVRITYAAAGSHRIQFTLPAGWTMSAKSETMLEASGKVGGRRGSEASGVEGFQSTELDKPIDTASFQCSNTSSGSNTCTATLKDAPRTVTLKTGISYISADQATKNRTEELGSKTFEQVRAEGRAIWNTALAKIVITGCTATQRRIFYTSLWRSQLRMMDITEGGRYFSGFDNKVHDAEGHDFYVEDGVWDTYRSLHPLQLLIEPQREQDALRSYIRMYQQSGWLPVFPYITGERAVMLGNHTASILADAYVKGYRDFDAEIGLRAAEHNTLDGTHLPWTRGEATDLDRFYQKSGYFPALAEGAKETEPRVHPFERRQASSVTLENAYDDWCIAQLAAALGHTDDAAKFTARAKNYALLFNPATGFIEAKTQDGKWVPNFDPVTGGGQGGRAYFAEVNSWVDTFHVQHDPAGLITLMGGRDKFIAKLDTLFQRPVGENRFTFLGQFPDMTGLIGMYPQGNEPAFHIPYLYVFAGQPWKTQRRIRQILETQYGDGPQGLAGDEDTGALSSWYVFSAMGFYPVAPGSPAYEIGSPLFTKTALTLALGKVLTIVANNNSATNKYIQSATLNGKPLTRAWFTHADITDGGTLVFQMGSTPNTTWGAAPEDAPPSMSK